jgi:LPXTG-motif cell wall-anchored protein
VPVGPSLPQTGGVADGPLRAGAALLAVGGLVLLAVRNRRPTAHART